MRLRRKVFLWIILQNIFIKPLLQARNINIKYLLSVQCLRNEKALWNHHPQMEIVQISKDILKQF